MKTAIKTLSAAALLLFTLACSKDDDDTIKIQGHDKNQMMILMHEMMMEMDMMVPSMDPDNDFATMMMMHHQGAINMANAELKDGNDAVIKALAQQVITAQNVEMQQLKAFLTGHPAHIMVMEAHEKMKMSMEKMTKNADLQIINGDADHDFSILLIQHHQSAIEMAQIELDYGTHDNMKQLARIMIEEQGMEIKELQEWLLANGRN